MNKTFAIITPSFKPDFDRCKIMCESLDKYLTPPFTHYLCVDEKEIHLFKKLENSNRKIITTEAILPPWLYQVCYPLHNYWISHKTIPVRGWIKQQLIKLSLAEHIKEDVFLYIDSDVAMIRPYNLNNLVKDDKVRLYRKTVNEKVLSISERHKWHKRAAKLLGIPCSHESTFRYIGQMITWKRDNLIKLYKKLEDVSGRPWQECVCNSIHFSEYVLYGVFCDRILKEESGHYHDEMNYFLEYWVPQDMTDKQLAEFKQQLQPQHIGLMISSKAKMGTSRYMDLIKQLQG
jgi:hypothetical protein